jgi:microcystin-dependent protein
MSEPFLGEIKIVSFNFPPKGWALCNGQFLPINQNQALFSLFGTTYGGNGQTTFALPNLQGRTPIHVGSGFTQGEVGGEFAHTLNSAEMPQHSHFPQAATATPSTGNPSGNLWASNDKQVYFDPPGSLVTMAPQAISNVGGSQAHENMSPYLVLNFIVALQGIFPSRN